MSSPLFHPKVIEVLNHAREKALNYEDDRFGKVAKTFPKTGPVPAWHPHAKIIEELDAAITTGRLTASAKTALQEKLLEIKEGAESSRISLGQLEKETRPQKPSEDWLERDAGYRQMLKGAIAAHEELAPLLMKVLAGKRPKRAVNGLKTPKQ